MGPSPTSSNLIRKTTCKTIKNGQSLGITLWYTQTFQIWFFVKCWALFGSVFTDCFAREGVFQVDLAEILRMNRFSLDFDRRLSVSGPGQILAGRSGEFPAQESEPLAP